MPLLKLNRINKGGEIYVNSEQIRFIEIESGSSTVNMGPGNVYAVQETPEGDFQRRSKRFAYPPAFAMRLLSSGLVEKKAEII